MASWIRFAVVWGVCVGLTALLGLPADGVQLGGLPILWLCFLLAFTVQWVLDDTLSRGSGGACDGDRNGDFGLDLGFRAVEDLPGTYTGYMLERMEGSWTEQTMAVFDASDGSFVFAIGELDEARDDGGTTVFDSSQWYGRAIVWDGSPRPEDEEDDER